MSSKGIDFYGTNLVPGATVSLAVAAGNDDGTRLAFPTGELAAGPAHLELDSHSGLSWFESTKPIVLGVDVGGERLGVQQLVETMYPKLPDGPLCDTYRTYSHTAVPTPAGPVAISYGFNDTSGQDGTSDTVYITLTPGYDRWMGDLAAERPELHDRPLSTMVLPGSHNAGMFSPGAGVGQVLSLLDAAGGAGALGVLPVGLLGQALLAGGGFGLQLAINSAFCQKDDITTQLDLGTRFFDIRPGAVPGLGLYHVHNVIPGATIPYVLSNVVQWLAVHPTEVVVLSLSSNVAEAFRVGDAVIEAAVADAMRDAPFLRGDATHLDRPVGELVAAGVRLITLISAPRWGSWGDAYETSDPARVVDRLDGMTAAARTTFEAKNKVRAVFTLLELQTSGTRAGLAWGAKNGASGELIRLKPRFDAVTHPWVRRNADRFRDGGLLVLGNDFVDGALTALAVEATRARLDH
jgi:hypothetical protein